MKQSRRRGPKRSLHQPPVPAPNGCRALMIVDGQPIRRKAKRNYQKAVRDLESARTDLVRFQEEDQPAFTRWFHGQFGDLLTELRELNQKLQYHQMLVYAVELEMDLAGCSAAQAYRRVMAERKAAEAASESEAEDQNDPFEDEGDECYEGAEDDDPFAHLFDDSEPGFDDPQDEEDELSGAALSARKRTGGRVKELYRALVRRLHPDTQGEMSAQQREWWHQAQEAYQNQNVEQLEVILSLCEIEEAGTTEHASVSVLRRITDRLRQSFRQLKAQLRRCRNDPAWGFSSRTDLGAVAEQIKHGLQIQKAQLLVQLTSLESMLERWARPTERQSSSRRSAGPTRKRRPPVNRAQAEFYF